jgi:GNAT superfamily N-acetyltransferase
MKNLMNNSVLTYELSKMDTDAVCDFIQNSYWRMRLNKAEIIKSFQFSSCIGLLADGQQLAFARAVSDQATCAYIKDFFVLDPFQKRGLGRRLLQGLMNHPDLLDVPLWYLGTKDAHGFYEACGFTKSPNGIYMYLNREA